MPVQDLNALRAFRDVARAGGFAAAHRETGQSRATLSRHVAALEEDVGVRLIERSTRSFRLTDQGQLLFNQALEIFAQLDEAVALVEEQQHFPQGLVRIAIPPSILTLDVGQKMLDFLEAQSAVRVQVEASNREVDIRHEGFDLVIRARTEMDYPLDYVPVVLARSPMAIVAHPSLRELMAETLQDTVKQVPVIAWTGSFGESRWRLQGPQGAVDLSFSPRLIVDDILTLRQAVLRGLGMALLPRTFVHEDLSLGRLIEVKSDLSVPDRILHAVHLGQYRMRPAVRHLLNWLKEANWPSDAPISQSPDIQ